ncbi:MAG: DUF4198 domain-containing protein [Sulfitobacter sp.]
MVLAHEFWIEPENYQVQPSKSFSADLRNGQEFSGTALGFFENRTLRFDTAMGDAIAPVEGRMGDRPALQSQTPDREGLWVLLHEAAPSTVTYKEWDKFLSFAKHKDFPDAQTTHLAEGWPTDKFRETYTRHSKALVAVGNGAGSDRAYGLATEFVALSNPYLPDFSGMMQVQLLYQGTARSDAQIEVFDRAPDGTVTITLHRTDAQGNAAIPAAPGHSYLYDAVVLRPAPRGDAPDAPVWETLWAALTFAVPK